MPFEQLFPRSLTAVGVQTYAPVSSGVYGISNAREWIYIGETDNIQGTLLRHLQNRDTAAMKCLPTGFVFEVCERELRAGRQNRLIIEYGPTCNSLKGA